MRSSRKSTSGSKRTEKVTLDEPVPLTGVPLIAVTRPEGTTPFIVSEVPLVFTPYNGSSTQTLISVPELRVADSFWFKKKFVISKVLSGVIVNS